MMFRLFAGCALLVVAAASAIVPSARWSEAVDKQLLELNSSLAQIQADLSAAGLEPTQKKKLGELEENFKAEKKLLLERRELLRRLETQGLLIYLSPPLPSGKAP